ncbi:MAG: tRNA(fMet)-specific endonuclease VapC [Natronomonas sp.]
MLASTALLDTTEQTANEAVSLPAELVSRGVPTDHPNALIAASARDHGGTFATAENHFREEPVRSVLAVAEYAPY